VQAKRKAEAISDEELVAAIAGKDIHALEVFYDRHRVLAYSLAYRTLSDASDAEDVVQEAFTSVWRSSKTYSPTRASARSWLLTVVHHRCIDKLRGRQSRPIPAPLAEGETIPSNTDVWREVAEGLTADNVRSALQSLPEDQRKTIELAYFGGHSQSQIARSMSVPLGTVKGRMRIALHKLRSLLEDHRPEMGLE